MKYYVEQKPFSFNNNFDIFDEAGNRAYYVEAKAFSLSHKFYILDRYEQEVAEIAQKVWSWSHKFEIKVEEEVIGTIVKEATFFKEKFYLEDSDLTIEGDYKKHDYRIYDNGKLFATIEKGKLFSSDKYCIDIQDAYEPVIGIAIMLTIDAIQQMEAAALATVVM